MIVFLHGFDWTTYAEVVMPALARWLLERDESTVASLFEQTRCAQEEALLPAPMQRLRSWVRAQAFVQKLPRGLNSLQEYEQLCSAEEFTLLSDRYLHLHPPQLYQQNDALRTIWGAIIETYCLPWRDKALNGDSPPLSAIYLADEGDETGSIDEQSDRAMEIRGELISLLKTAGLHDLAHQIDESISHIERFRPPSDDPNTFDSTTSGNSDHEAESEFDETPRTGELDELEEIGLAGAFDESPRTGELGTFSRTEALGEPRAGQREVDAGETDAEEPFITSFDDGEEAGDEEDMIFSTQLGGIEIGGASDLLHLRGWLAGTSLRAMVLFEYLACGRRCMPFGYITGEPYNYAGYLTPGEVQQLAACLRNVLPPSRRTATQDQQRFWQQQTLPITSEHVRLVDEVLPLYASEFLQAVRAAASEHLGLICAVE